MLKLVVVVLYHPVAYREFDVLEELGLVVRISCRGRYLPADKLSVLESRLRRKGLLPVETVGATA